MRSWIKRIGCGVLNARGSLGEAERGRSEMTRAEQRERAKGWNAINRLRQRYRTANGDEAELRAEIIQLAEAWGYPAKANAELFDVVGWGAWLPEFPLGPPAQWDG